MSNYEEILKECSKIAENEYHECTEKLKGFKRELTCSHKKIEEIISNLSKSDINDQSTSSSINQINESISELLKEKFNEFEETFNKKSKNLSDFTVTLFGRTKAGKSTIREALTNGDGSTIGKGAQRTTRDVQEYQWNSLRILDTPGFDAYQGEEDTKIAFSQVDETDIILFLITNDSIEESEFKKLALIRRENKPVIILLNVLHDIKHSVKRKQLLKDPKKYVSTKAIKGTLREIKISF